jgi:hypothetical protein
MVGDDRVEVQIKIRRISRMTCAVLAGAMTVLSAAAQSSAVPDQQLSSTVARVALLDVVVRDPNGAVVPNAAVRLTNLSTDAKILQRTDSRGLARFLDFPEETYTIWVTAQGFEAESVTNFKLSIGQATGIEVRLLVRQQVLDGVVGVIVRRKMQLPLSARAVPFLAMEPLPPAQDSSPKKH